MKRVRDIRPVLETIEGALVRFEPERAERGEEEGAKQIWGAAGATENEQTLAPADRTDAWDDEDEDDQTPARELEELIEFAPPNEEDVVKALGGAAKAGEILRSRIVARGVDGLGWYVSFHQTGLQWGIYIPVSGLLVTALGAFGKVNCSMTTKVELAFHLIHQHELFHFAVDFATAQLELLSGRPCWVPGRKLKGPGGYNIREEKLANTWMLRSLWGGSSRLKFRGRSESVRAFVKQMPEGYCDADGVTRASFHPEVDQLVCEYATISGFDGRLLRQLDGARLLPLSPRIDWRQCPVHIIHDEKRHGLPTLGIDLLRLISQLRETDKFQRELSKLAPSVRELWAPTKRKLLADVTIPGLDFKHFEHKGERVYSVRLNRGYRAHLRKTSDPPGWEAYSVGDHKSMGHG